MARLCPQPTLHSFWTGHISSHTLGAGLRGYRDSPPPWLRGSCLTVAPVTSKAQLERAVYLHWRATGSGALLDSSAGASRRLLTIGRARIIASNRCKGQQRIDPHCLVRLIAALGAACGPECVQRLFSCHLSTSCVMLPVGGICQLVEMRCRDTQWSSAQETQETMPSKSMGSITWVFRCRRL